jgi:hypothetical protein
MAVTKTYDFKKSIREDLADIIYDISPTRTPFMSNIGRGTADSTYHEWQTDQLAAPDVNNAAVEGADAVDTTYVPTNRVGNYTQISTKTIDVSGTSNAVNTAGMRTIEAYDKAKKGRELKRDMESILLNNQSAVVGNTATARKLAGFPAWLRTNVVANGLTPPTMSSGDDGYPNAGWTGAAASVDFTEDMLKAAIQKLFKNGGETKMLMVGTANKVKVSSFAGIAQQRVNINTPKQSFIVGASDTYVSDFGNLDVVPNIFQPEQFAFLVDPEYAKVAYLRPFQTEMLAKTGDARRTQMLAEYTLVITTERAHAIIANLNG